MKGLIIILLILISTFSYSQEINDVEIYTIKWNAKYKFARSINNFKEYHHYYMRIGASDFNIMFLNYDDFVLTMNKNDTICCGNFLNSLVEFTFENKKTLSVFFDIKGNYYFQGKWHKINNSMYYLLFQYFSDIIIPQSILDNAKIEFEKDKYR